MTLIHAPELYPRKKSRFDRTAIHDAAIREAAGVDPVLIAATLGVTERFVRQRQRAIGLRKCRNPRDKDN